MARQFKVEVTDEGTVCISVDGEQTILSVDSDIQAEEIYKSLQYQPKDTYTFEDDETGKVGDGASPRGRQFAVPGNRGTASGWASRYSWTVSAARAW